MIVSNVDLAVFDLFEQKPITMIEKLKNNSIVSSIIYKTGRSRANFFITQIKNYITAKDKILDLGCGPCNITELLLEQGIDVTPLDVINRSFVKKINPIIYDGANIPFKNKYFDKVLLLSVLHHTSHPENIIRESMRVSNNIIIMEDIYTNNFDKQFTFFMDSLWNLEFKDHPRSNKTDNEWRDVFKKMDLKLKDVQFWNDIFFKHSVYYLEA